VYCLCCIDGCCDVFYGRSCVQPIKKLNTRQTLARIHNLRCFQLMFDRVRYRKQFASDGNTANFR